MRIEGRTYVWHMTVLNKRVSCYYYFLSLSPFFHFHVSCLFLFFIYLRCSVTFGGKLIFHRRFFLDILGCSWMGGLTLASALWKHPDSRPTRHMDDASQSLAWQMAQFGPPASLRQGSILPPVSFPTLCYGSHLLCSLGGTSLFLINGDFLFSFLNMVMLTIVFQCYFLSFLYAWSRKLQQVLNHH